MGKFFDDVLGFDPNGGGIHDTFLGDIFDNPLVSTVLKFTPAAPFAWGWDTGSAAGAGKWGQALLSGLGTYGSMGGFGYGGTGGEAAMAAEDAAQLASQGLDLNQIQDILGQSYGLDAITAAEVANATVLGASPQTLAGLMAQSTGPYNWNYTPTSMSNVAPYAGGDPLGLKLSTSLGGLSGSTAAPIPATSATQLGTNGFESLQAPNFGLGNPAGQMKFETGLGGSSTPKTLNDIMSSGVLGKIGNPTSGAAVPTQPTPPAEAEKTTSLGSTIGKGLDYVNEHLTAPVTRGVDKLVSWSGGSLPDIFGTGNTGLDTSDLIGAGIKTMGAMDIAGDLTKQAALSDVFAKQREYATGKWTGAYDDPESLFQEYMKGQGAQYLKQSAAKMASSGNRGQLPNLMNMARENFYSNYLPQYRQGVNPSQFNSKPDSSLYGAAANAKGTAYSAIPNALSSIFGRKYRTPGDK